jgi:hypothetical protein
MLRSNVMRALVIVALYGWCVPGSAQTPTLAERVEASGGKPLTIPALPETVPLSIDELSARSDLVVQGKLVRLRSYVSEDGTKIFTDYHLVPRQMLVVRTKVTTPTPGQTPPIVLAVLGGEVMINGTRVTMSNSKMLPLKDQADFLIFARGTNGDGTRFELTGGSAGIFEVEASSVKSLLRTNSRNREIEGVPLDKIVAKVREAASK